jgi:NAD(P)-dependent dehydrogenase (short-subunit alcohol dehydrogenase family)
MPSYLVTGASRGLGLGFVIELLKDPNNIVIATARNTTFRAKDLQELKARQTDNRLHLVDLDVSSSYGVLVAAEEVSKILPDGLDCLISNAGVAYTGQESFENV